MNINWYKVLRQDWTDPIWGCKWGGIWWTLSRSLPWPLGHFGSSRKMTADLLEHFYHNDYCFIDYDDPVFFGDFKCFFCGVLNLTDKQKTEIMRIKPQRLLDNRWG